MASQKAIDNAMRLRYVRALERFHKSIISYLSTTAVLSKEGYAKKIESALKILQKVEEIALYKGDLQELQKLVQKMIAYKQSDKEIEEMKEDILYLSNQLDKTKNARRYKKEKHSRSIYEEWE
ncbi:MAG: hypothetical protein OEL19_07105 [Sulfurimonas sp.]|nr:hypothetical protein [Sulfurimonas sp.]